MKTISQIFSTSNIYASIARLSKKSKNGNFSNFACNDINTGYEHQNHKFRLFRQSLQIAKGGGNAALQAQGFAGREQDMLCLFLGHCGCVCEVAERVLHFFYDFNTCLDSMTFCQVFWIIIRKPYLPRFIFPD